MVNRQSRDPGEIRRFNDHGRIGGDIPSFAVDTGAVFRSLAEVGASLSSQLLKLAEDAKAKASAEGGLAAGAQSGASYLEMRAAEARSAGRRPSRAQVQAPAEIRNLIAEAAKRHGVDPGALMKTAELESSFNPRAKNPNSSAGGLFQFIDSTAKRYGLADRYDPAQAADAAARLMKDNATYLRGRLGREPTAGELYLAHQQGAGGAAKLLANPNADAAAIVGADAVRLNGGRAGMTAGEFASLWTRKAEGASAASGGGKAGLREIDSAPLQLRRDGTASGAAYDKAAISAYAWRVEAGLSTDIAAAAQEFSDDPAGLTKRLEEIREHYLTGDDNLADPELREKFEVAFAERSQAYMLQAVAAHGRKLDAERAAAAGEGLSARELDLERQAYALGANPDGDGILAGQTGRVMASIDGALEQGAITPAQAADWRRKMSVAVARGRVHGTFAALSTPQEKEKFAIGLLDEWQTGEGPLAALDHDQVKALSTTLYNEARREANEKSAESALARQRIAQLIDDDTASIVSTGKGLDPATGLDAETVGALLGPEKLIAWQAERDVARNIWSATAGMEAQSAGDIAARLELLAPKAGEAGYDTQEKVFAAATRRAEAILKHRAADPADAAEKAFPAVAELAAGTDYSDAASLQALISARLQAQAAMGLGELDRQPLTAAEARSISRRVSAIPDETGRTKAMRELVPQIEATYGPHAQEVLTQILGQTGVDRQMADYGARLLRKIESGGAPSAGDRREGTVLGETDAADKAGAGRAGATAPMPNYKQIQLLLSDPALAPQFDQKFGPNAAARYLQRRQDPATFETPEGKVTIEPDGSETFEPAKRF